MVNIHSLWKVRSIGILLLLLILISACGPGETATPTEAPPKPTPTQTPVPPTETPAPSPTPEPDAVEYEDPEGDCLDNNNAPTACAPLGVDMLTINISRQSPLTIVVEVAADGFDALRANDIFGFNFGFDLDQDPTTGSPSGWPVFHGIGPDLVIHWFEEDGEVVAEGASFYAADGSESEGDASLVTWTVLDNNHIQIELSEELVPPQSFSVAGDIFTPDLYDHFVDNGHLTFPEGEVVPVE